MACEKDRRIGALLALAAAASFLVPSDGPEQQVSDTRPPTMYQASTPVDATRRRVVHPTIETPGGLMSAERQYGKKKDEVVEETRVEETTAEDTTEEGSDEDEDEDSSDDEDDEE